MLALQEIFDIAVRHQTTVADRTVEACVERANRTGERLIPPRGMRVTAGEVMYVHRN